MTPLVSLAVGHNTNKGLSLYTCRVKKSLKPDKLIKERKNNTFRSLDSHYHDIAGITEKYPYIQTIDKSSMNLPNILMAGH